jgi:hypothetical protein
MNFQKDLIYFAPTSTPSEAYMLHKTQESRQKNMDDH